MNARTREIIEKILGNEGTGWHEEGSYRRIIPTPYQPTRPVTQVHKRLLVK